MFAIQNYPILSPLNTTTPTTVQCNFHIQTSSIPYCCCCFFGTSLKRGGAPKPSTLHGAPQVSLIFRTFPNSHKKVINPKFSSGKVGKTCHFFIVVSGHFRRPKNPNKIRPEPRRNTQKNAQKGTQDFEDIGISFTFRLWKTSKPNTSSRPGFARYSKWICDVSGTFLYFVCLMLFADYLIIYIYIYTSNSTARGGGGSCHNRKLVGEIGGWKSRMTKQNTGKLSKRPTH